ncbi:hypothetical protein QBC34DRAFT_430957 [Podospora aff. communis PSN243]|uniref:DUF1996 domain-containing protein n=1 Tax=Podospora aff. communis PSN243 TaxID=3040156 RepID=A0AAV9G7F6_9PEZI|nr:hypothetical protein QBC34DRAFT_430957 [Podospora aff. communis PSN243]
MSAVTAAGPCAVNPTCTASGQGLLSTWKPKTFAEPDKTGTYVVVQVINTVLDTTSYSTIGNELPSGYKPPPTNAAGTKIATITYTHRREIFTTTLAYPTPFLIFPNVYTILGGYQHDSPSGTTCVSGQNKTFDVLSNPQPPWSWDHPKWNLTQWYDPNDPLGWGHGEHEADEGAITDIGATYPLGFLDIIDLLPDDNAEVPHAVAKKCKYGGIHSPYVVAPNPNWKVVAHTSVVYEGSEADAAKPATKASGGSQPNKPTDSSRVKNPEETPAGAKGNPGVQEGGWRLCRPGYKFGGQEKSLALVGRDGDGISRCIVCWVVIDNACQRVPHNSR